MSQLEQDDYSAAIAVVGMGVRVPGASSPDELWAAMLAGQDLIEDHSKDELLTAGVAKQMVDRPDYVRRSGHLEQADCFDAAFFGLAASEAEMLDPQHRLFLETAWSAVEDAGHDPARPCGQIGLFGGCFMNKYLPLNLYANKTFLESPLSVFARNYNDKDFLCGRVAHLMNLTGPVATVQTACSTSLVATHQACQAILTYECDLALVGGASLNLPYPSGYLALEGTMFSPDGQCRTFDADTTGTLPGNGSVVLLLRRLSDALADGDHIRAVIRGSAVNNDGSAKASFTAPNVQAQTDVIASAHAVAQVTPDEIGYVEAHGTGTRLGDPIEVAALNEAFRRQTKKTGFCALGSIKANMGHLDAAAGVAGLARAVLSVEHATIPPQVNYTAPNPEFQIDQTAFYVPTQSSPWPKTMRERVAATSSFGVGGTNAHVVISEAPKRQDLPAKKGPQLFVVSAKSAEALAANKKNLAAALQDRSDADLAAAAYTLSVGRGAFAFRDYVVAATGEDAARGLLQTGKPPAEKIKDRGAVFMFPGVGTQYEDMALDLYKAEDGFRSDIDHAADVLADKLGFDIRRYILPSMFPGDPLEREAVPNVVSAVFTVSYALGQQWIRWGIKPTALLGHSLGEYVAACTAGVLRLEDALDLTVRRGKIFDNIPQGRMMVVPMAHEAVEAELDGRLTLGAINAPTLSLVSGPKAELEALAGKLHEKFEINCSILPVRMASHSVLLDPFLADFTEMVSEYDLNKPKIPYLSCLSGTWITDDQATDPKYWAQQLRHPVRFAQMAALVANDQHVCVEVGPGTTLTSLLRAQGFSQQPLAVASLRHPMDERSDKECLMAAMGTLWSNGLPADPLTLHTGNRRRISLPTYAFERTRHWIEPDRLVGPGTPWDGPVRNVVKRPAERKASVDGDERLEWTAREIWVADIWTEILGARNLDQKSDFVAVGGHSLLAAQVLARIKQDIAVNLQVSDIFSASTITTLAALIDNRMAGKHAIETDLVAEVSLCADIGKLPHPAAARANSMRLLTGATGFLGSFLLDELLSDQTAADVAVLVRASSAPEGYARLDATLTKLSLPKVDRRRVQIIPGDLAAPQFGADAAQYDDLCQNAGAIYHCGSWVNFAQPYNALKPANVTGTQEIIRLSASGRIRPVHFISTAFVNMGAIVAGVDHIPEDGPLSPPLHHDTAYTQSKWVAESLCHLGIERGLPISIYRPGNVLGGTKTGAANATDYLCRIMAGSIALGAAPKRDYPLPVGAVDDVARAIVSISHQPAVEGQVFHVIQPEPMAWNTLMDCLPAAGYKVAILPWEQWCTRLSEALSEGKADMLLPLASLLDAPANRPMPDFGVANITAARRLSDLPFPILDMSYLNRMVNWLAQAGHLPLRETASSTV